MANDKLTWQELRKAVAENANCSEQEAGMFLTALLDGIMTGLKEDKQVKIKGLGTFALKAVAARKSVNIATGESFTIEGYNKLDNARLLIIIGRISISECLLLRNIFFYLVPIECIAKDDVVVV